MKSLFYNLLAASHHQLATSERKRLEALIPPGPARVALPFVFKAKGHFKAIAPRQNPSEIEALYLLVREQQPRTVVEIGTSRGGSLYLWCQAAHPQAHIVSIDMPGGSFGGSYPDCREPFYKAFATGQQTVDLIRADSHLADTRNQTAQALNHQPVDFLFIDGDHRYEGVKQDFQLYAPLVRPGGLIAFHDILPRPDMPDIQVHKLWNDIRDRYDTREIVGPEGSGRTIGIGCLTVPENGIPQADPA
ncbi:O-methyltransferase [Mucisphaera sp.]|uniref:O-methyltransferase n=1 Tax=Mucisphaera sp. TaxID=2913024 RepID=UPI003D0DD422